MITGAFLLWQGRAQDGPALPPPPEKAAGAPMLLQTPPAATEKSREEKRFARADRDNDGKIRLPELLEPRRRLQPQRPAQPGRICIHRAQVSTQAQVRVLISRSMRSACRRRG
jgi:hypothetical protein